MFIRRIRFPRIDLARTTALAAAAGLTVAFAIAAPGCKDEGAFEQAGENVDDAVEDAGDAVEDAADDLEDAVEGGG